MNKMVQGLLDNARLFRDKGAMYIHKAEMVISIHHSLTAICNGLHLHSMRLPLITKQRIMWPPICMGKMKPLKCFSMISEITAS